MKDRTPFRRSTEHKKTRTHTRLFFITMIWKRGKKKLGIKNVLVRLNAMENHAIAQIFREYKIQQQQRLYMTVATTSNCFVIFMHWQQLVLPASLGLAECAKSAVTVRQCVQNAMALHCITAPRDSIPCKQTFHINRISSITKTKFITYHIFCILRSSF